MLYSTEGQLHEARKFLEVCKEFGNIMDSIHQGLLTYQTHRETADLEEYEKLDQVFVTALPAMRQVLDGFHKEFLKIVKVLGGTLVYDDEE
jgi:hypothetical protein